MRGAVAQEAQKGVGLLWLHRLEASEGCDVAGLRSKPHQLLTVLIMDQLLLRDLLHLLTHALSERKDSEKTLPPGAVRREYHHSELRPHLSLHAADANQLIQDQKGTVGPVVSIHSFFFSESLIEAFLCFFKGLLSQKRQTVMLPMKRTLVFLFLVHVLITDI